MSEKGFTQFQFSSDGNVNDYWPEWSPDGSYIIYGRSSIDPAIPYLVRLNYDERNTGNEIRITSTGENPISPIYDAAFSYDGQWLAFESWPDGRNHDIFILSIDGEQLFRLTNDPGYDFQPDWRPVINP
jgi:Tol biopolymer transport system component